MEASNTSALTAVREGPALEEWSKCQQVARDCGIPCVSLRDDGFDASLLQQLHSEVLATYKVIPIHQEGDLLTLAMADPLDVVDGVGVAAVLPADAESSESWPL